MVIFICCRGKFCFPIYSVHVNFPFHSHIRLFKSKKNILKTSQTQYTLHEGHRLNRSQDIVHLSNNSVCCLQPYVSFINWKSQLMPNKSILTTSVLQLKKKDCKTTPYFSGSSKYCNFYFNSIKLLSYFSPPSSNAVLKSDHCFCWEGCEHRGGDSQ